MENKAFTNISAPIDSWGAYGSFEGLSLQRVFIIKYGIFPSCEMFAQDGRSIKVFDIAGLMDYFKDNDNVSIIPYNTHNLDTNEDYLGISVMFNDMQMLARIEKNISESYILYSNDIFDKMIEFRDTLLKFYKEEEDEDDNNHVFTLAQGQNGFYLTKAKVNPVKDFNIKLQYNDDFIEADETLKDFIEDTNKSGIIMLHGAKGTGKTTYIRHLIDTYEELKFVTIPPAMVSYLNDPTFTSFMHNKLSKTIIILEDCENAIQDRKVANSSNSVSVLLNIGDGLMSDDLGIKFICTFNADTGTIDEALLRKGRLALKYEFKNLCAEKTKALIPIAIKDKINEYKEQLKTIKEDTNMVEEKKKDKINRLNKKIKKLKEIPEYTDNKPLSLADIYNIDEESFVKDKKQIGF